MAKEVRDGTRRKRENRPLREPDLGYYYIVTDTEETERTYLEGLRSSVPDQFQNRLVIKIYRDKTKKLVETCLEKASLQPQYSKPWIVFDRDRVTDFDKIILEAEKAGVSVGWSNPCIEIWFEAYFGRMNTYQDSVSCNKGFEKVFRAATSRKYDKADKKIYELLTSLGNESTAIKTADSKYQEHIRNNRSKPSSMSPCTTLHRLVKEIRNTTDEASLTNE